MKITNFKLKLAALLLTIGVFGGVFATSLNPAQDVGKVKIDANTTVESLLAGKTSAQKSDIKAEAINSHDLKGVYNSAEYGVSLQITGQRLVKGGIEVYAKGWKDGNQLGFGSDGSVEIERFIFTNPPILVEDPNGPIVREYTNSQGEIIVRHLKEDPAEAIKQSLAHTIKITGKEGSNIVVGKIGRSTSTFYPDPSVESTSVDGYSRGRGGDTASWATTHDMAGNGSGDSAAAEECVKIWAASGADKWFQISRCFFLFDSSALDDGATISAAVMSVKTLTVGNDCTGSYAIDAYTSTPASNTAIANGDYQNIGTTSQTGSAIGFGSLANFTYMDFTFNATGRGNVSKTGISKFGLRESIHDAANSAPTHSGACQLYIDTYYADEAGTTSDPKLVVTYSTTSIKTVDGLAVASVKTVLGTAIASVKTILGLP